MIKELKLVLLPSKKDAEVGDIVLNTPNNTLYIMSERQHIVTLILFMLKVVHSLSGIR